MAYENEDVELIFEEMDEKLSKTINAFSNEMKMVRAGRANQHILDKVVVNYYGTETPINQMANISVSEARVLVVSVWDKSALKDVEKAIISANIGINPNNDGSVIRLIFPEITEEKRKLIVKEIKSSSENAKVVLRNARRDANDELKKLEKAKSITEDEIKTYEKDVDKKLADAIDSIEKILKDKEVEVMSV